MASFRLLDLPQKIQDKIYEKYLEGSSLQVKCVSTCQPQGFQASPTCEYKRSTLLQTLAQHVLVFEGLPSLDIELVSRKVCGDVRKVRNETVSHTLAVKDMSCRVGSDVQRLFIDTKYDWVREHVDKVIFDDVDLTFPKHYPEFVCNFTCVRDIQINFWSSMSSNRHGIGMIHGILDGDYDIHFDGPVQKAMLPVLRTLMARKYGPNFTIKIDHTITYDLQDGGRWSLAIEVRKHKIL